MAQALPFSALLDVLRARGLPIGLIEYRDLAVLLSRYDGASREELRSAIAALFARDRTERQVIVECFDELFPGDGPAVPPGPETISAATDTPKQVPVRGGTPWTRRRRLIAQIAAIILVAVLVPVGYAWFNRPDQPRTNDGGGAGGGGAGGTTEERPPPPAPPAQPVKSRRARIVVPALVSLGTLLVLATAYRSASGRSRWLRTVRRSTLAQLTGPRFYRWPVDHRAMAVPRHIVEEVASILGRRHQVAETGNHVDVGQTLRRTLEAGLFPQIVFEPPCRTLPILVLHDVGPDMRAWRSRVDLFLRDLNRVGIPVRRFYFDASPHTLWRSDAEPRTTLDELSRSEDDAALLVISTGAGVRAALDEGPRSWLRLLEKWRSRTWVTPLTSRAHWRAELTRVPMSVWPMTPGGLNAAARELLFDDTHRPMAPPQAIAGARAVSADDVERVKRLAALVPQPAPVEVVDALRARYTPDVPGDVLLPLIAQNTVLDPAHVRLPDAEVARLLAAIRRDDPDREIAVRRFLLELLVSVEPPAGTAARLRWETDVALQRTQEADAAGTDAAESRDALRTLAAGPLADEVNARARAAAASGTLQSSLKTAANTSIATEPGAPVTAAPRFTAPRVSDLARAVVVTAAAVAVFVSVGGARSQPIPHVENAYTLKWEPENQRLVFAATDAVSGRRTQVPVLTRNAEPIEPFEWRSTAGQFVPGSNDRGAWYRFMAQLPEGNYALSNLEWVPRAAPTRVDIKANGSDGPVDVVNGDTWSISWTSTSMTACDLASPSGQSGIAVAGTDGPIRPGHPWYPKTGQSVTLSLRCTDGTSAVRDSVIVNIIGSTAPATLSIAFTDVYGTRLTNLSGMLTVRNTTGAIAAKQDLRDSSIAITPSEAPPYSIQVEASRFETATFPVSASAMANVIARPLIMEPSTVRVDPSGFPKGIGPVTIESENPEEIVNAFNILQRAERTIVTVERPQGTWSRSLLATIQSITASKGAILADIERDAYPYVQRWIDLTARGRDNPKGRDDDGGSESGPRELDQAAAPPAGGPQQSAAQRIDRVSIPSGRTILDLQLDEGPPILGARPAGTTTLLMSLRRVGGGNAHPYTIHQLLVQDGFRDLFRLRQRPPAADR